MFFGKKEKLSDAQIAQAIERTIQRSGNSMVDAPAIGAPGEQAGERHWSVGTLAEVRKEMRQASPNLSAVSGVWFQEQDLPKGVKADDVARVLGEGRVSIRDYMRDSEGGSRVMIATESRPVSPQDIEAWSQIAQEKKEKIAGASVMLGVAGGLGGVLLGTGYALSLANPAGVGVSAAIGVLAVWGGLIAGGLGGLKGGAELLRAWIDSRITTGTQMAKDILGDNSEARKAAKSEAMDDARAAAQGLAPAGLGERLAVRRAVAKADAPAVEAGRKMQMG
jgi:hypothetical protein